MLWGEWGVINILFLMGETDWRTREKSVGHEASVMRHNNMWSSGYIRKDWNKCAIFRMITLVKSQISGIVPLIAGLEMAWYSNIGTNEAFQEPEMSAITELNEVNKSLQWILLSSNSPEMVSVCPLATAAPPSHPYQGRIFCKTFRSKMCVLSRKYAGHFGVSKVLIFDQ